MKTFTPINKYVLIDRIKDSDSNAGFNFVREEPSLVAVKILAFDECLYPQLAVDKIAIVFSTMIQECEYNKNKFLIVPDSALLGFIEE